MQPALFSVMFKYIKRYCCCVPLLQPEIPTQLWLWPNLQDVEINVSSQISNTTVCVMTQQLLLGLKENNHQ